MPLSADDLLASLERMRTSHIWAPVMASLSERHWYEASPPFGRVHPKLLKRLLADALTCKGQDPSSCVLSPALVRRLQACFGMSVSPQIQTAAHPQSHKFLLSSKHA